MKKGRIKEKKEVDWDDEIKKKDSKKMRKRKEEKKGRKERGKGERKNK